MWGVRRGCIISCVEKGSIKKIENEKGSFSGFFVFFCLFFFFKQNLVFGVRCNLTLQSRTRIIGTHIRKNVNASYESKYIKGKLNNYIPILKTQLSFPPPSRSLSFPPPSRST